jgi:ribosomal protein L37AE/L43A
MSEIIQSPAAEKCPRCRSMLVGLEWEERINEREIQDLWRCWNCDNTFMTSAAVTSDQEPSVAEITRPFFTSLVME